MALENPVAFSVQSSPTLSGVPYQTPSRGTSRQSSCHRSSSQYMSSSPPPLPYDEDSYSRVENDRDDVGHDENISALDPRRFTPNLHASLVSEILSLRREVEGKSTALGSLEETLHDTKTENDQLTETLKNQVAEVRSVKKQMHLLENGTLSALGEMAKERDEAAESLNDTLKRLESSKTKLRAQEEEVERTHQLWDRDRQTWDVEKRNMERKVHVVEGRLRTILAEVTAAQAGGSHPSSTSNDFDDGMRETWFTKSSDTNSNRSNSVKGRSRYSGMSQDGSDVPNFRSSTLSGQNGFGGTRLNGLSLAEELEFNEEQDHLEESDQDGVASPGALPEEAQMRPRRLSVQQQTQDSKARKVLGLLVENNERLIQEAFVNEQPAERTDEKSNNPVHSPAFPYKDTATQFSPPSSPESRMHDTTNIVERNPEQTEHVANQRRKRVSIMSVSTEQTNSTKHGQPTAVQMISAGCQTLEPLKPPSSTIDHRKPSGTAPFIASDFPQMQSATTQTDDDDVLMTISGNSRNDPFMTVPIIAIHPPASRPPSSHNSVVLPPRTKNVACQASIERPVISKSKSVQTEDIRVGTRHVKIPPRSSFSHVPSKSSSKVIEEKDFRRNQTSPRKTSRRNLQRPPQVDPSLPRMKTPAAEFVDSYPGNNDNGPLNNHHNKQPTDLRRPVRVDSLFAGFESTHDLPPQLGEIDFSDDEFANITPVRKTLSKVQNSWKLVPQSESRGLDALEPEVDEPSSKEAVMEQTAPLRQVLATSKRQMPTKEAPAQSSAKPLKPSGISKEPDIRRTALISSGAIAHTTRARSPSAPVSQSKESITIPPPFPVPTRSSSRKIPISASDGAQSPTPYSTTFSGSRNQEVGRPPSKNAILRKVRSATAVPKFGRYGRRRSRSRSPPPSTSTIALESPQLPHLPHHEAIPLHARTPQQAKEQFLISSISPVIEAAADSVNNPTSVVDAIAQTMVGEWMWKYVRRRKSFGISESTQVEFDIGRSHGESGNGSGIRHKRWVWLAPYERAILWSSKQPTSGPALLGKSGRKLTIQSVLDVKDDTPMPRNSDPQLTFGRSILILTPQRALKFTAFNQERHQIWLTALSFLSHSSLGMNDIANVPPIPQQEYQRPPSQGSLGAFRRGTIRDSIRVAKSKGRHPLEGRRAHTNPVGVPLSTTNSRTKLSYGDDNLSLDAAEPPFVPRVSAHTHARKRSNTGPRSIPPNASQNFAIHASMPSNYSLKATLSHDGYSALPRGNGQNSAGHSTFESNGGSLNTVRNNFFDAVGTVRMEAFIDQGENRFGQSSPVINKKKEHKHSRNRQVRKKDLSYWGVGGPIGQEFSMAHGNDSRWRGEDPFKGF